MAAARQTRASWNKLLDDSDQPIWVVDAEWRIVLTNPALRTWWGEENGQLAGQKIQFGTPIDQSTRGELASALAPDPAVFTGRAVQTTIVHPLDATQRLAVQWIPFPDADGEVQSAWAWGTRADSPAEGSLDLDSSARITATTDWHALLAEHRARGRGPANLRRFVGESLAMQTLRVRAELAARQTAPVWTASVWIHGPAGSGRRTLARMIHVLGSDADVPLAEWDAAQLTPELLQRHMHDFAAHLKASQLKDASAARAAVLLANVQCLAAASLRELQELQEKAQVRLLLTSDGAPEKLVQQANWPTEFVAQWSVFPIEVPPLASRLADLPLVAQQIIEECNLAEKKQHRGCSLAALELLAAYRWPGDVAELADVIRTAHQAAGSVEIQPADLPPWLRQAESALRSPRAEPTAIDLDQQLADIERELLGRALRLADGNKTKAAKLVGWTRQRLLRRGEELGLIAGAAAKGTAVEHTAPEPEYIPDLPFEPEE